MSHPCHLWRDPPPPRERRGRRGEVAPAGLLGPPLCSNDLACNPQNTSKVVQQEQQAEDAGDRGTGAENSNKKGLGWPVVWAIWCPGSLTWAIGCADR
jgi:hypothetical protein